MTKKSSRTKSAIRGSKKATKVGTVKDLSPKSDVSGAVTAGGAGTGGGLRSAGTNDNLTLVRATRG